MEKKIDDAITTAKAMIPSKVSPDDMQKVAQSILNLAHVKSVNESLADYKELASDLDEELTFVLGRVRPSMDSTALVQVTQAALNLMNAKATLTAIFVGEAKKKKPGASAS